MYAKKGKPWVEIKLGCGRANKRTEKNNKHRLTKKARMLEVLLDKIIEISLNKNLFFVDYH